MPLKFLDSQGSPSGATSNFVHGDEQVLNDSDGTATDHDRLPNTFDRRSSFVHTENMPVEHGMIFLVVEIKIASYCVRDYSFLIILQLDLFRFIDEREYVENTATSCTEFETDRHSVISSDTLTATFSRSRLVPDYRPPPVEHGTLYITIFITIAIRR